MKRIIAVQGPIQLLTALTVLERQRKRDPSQKNEDTLLVGGLYTQKDQGEYSTAAICKQIARIWPFQKIFFTSLLEKLNSRCVVGFERSVEILRQATKLHKVDSVFVCRNWQWFNELVLESFPATEVTAFGDGLGLLDVGVPQFGRVFNPKGLVNIDNAYLTTPIEAAPGAFDKYSIHQVEPERLAEIVTLAAAQIQGLQDFCNRIREAGYANSSLILSSYDTESGTVRSFEDEIKLNCLLAERELEKGETVLVKGHPRASLGQADRLIKELNQRGYKAVSLTRFDRVPIELLAVYLGFKKVLAGHSFCAMSLAYLSKCKVVVGFGEKYTKEFFLKDWWVELLNSERLRALSVQQAYREQFQPIRFEEWNRYPEVFSEGPICLEPKIPDNNPPLLRAVGTLSILKGGKPILEAQSVTIPRWHQYRVLILSHLVLKPVRRIVAALTRRFCP